MPSIHVCSYHMVPQALERLGASHLVTLLAPRTELPSIPAQATPSSHLRLFFHDIPAPRDDHVHPGEEHVADILQFAQQWDRRAPMLVHCWAGISRSTAAAYMSACMLAPHEDEAELARRLRSASPTATPNPLMIAIADAKLRRNGRMTKAIEAIGRGASASEGVPFSLPIGPIVGPG